MTTRLPLVLVAAFALALTACGRRGAPEVPQAAADVPQAPVYAPEPEGAQAPDRRFVLDRLLQ